MTAIFREADSLPRPSIDTAWGWSGSGGAAGQDLNYDTDLIYRSSSTGADLRGDAGRRCAVDTVLRIAADQRAAAFLVHDG
jgi:hypothetical protein